MNKDISKIEEHDINTIWKNEERDFTPWLANNIELLASELGLEIEDAGTEEPVGGFSADIVGREMNTDETVVVENQYGRTDHDHLGKLLTYSAGKRAGFTIWLSEEFRPEHRSVLEWLNESGPKDIRFFGVRPRVVTIEGSEKNGFEFDVIVEPNDWERELIDDDLTETQQAYRDFYSDLVDAYSERRPDWYKLKPQPQSWLSFGAGMAGVRMGWSFHQGPEFSIELYIDTSDHDKNEAIIESLLENSEEIESNLNTELVWQRLPEKRACRIKMPHSTSGKITELDDSERETLIEWGVDGMDDFQDEIQPRVNNLNLDVS